MQTFKHSIWVTHHSTWEAYHLTLLTWELHYEVSITISLTIFNPLGILTPSVLEAKLIIQTLWTENVVSNGQIPDCFEKRWNNWYQKSNEIRDVALPRWIGYDNKNKYIEFLIFCDASSVAYGVVACIKLTNLENKEIICSFILAKS